jgi:hypothetical protein
LFVDSCRYRSDRAPARQLLYRVGGSAVCREPQIPEGAQIRLGRSDLNQDHVYANQALTHKLNEFGIPHEAEEYNGVWGNKTWGDDFRIYNEVLPFFHKHLVFAANIDSSLK